MSIELDPKEVLMCLNELGYYNISSKQLKEFLKDLKTLIKHDIKKSTKQNQENICPNPNRNDFYPTNNTSTSANNNNNNKNIINNGHVIGEVKQKSKAINAAELFDHLYTTSTASSRAKSIPKHISVISIAVRKTKNKPESSVLNPSENVNSSSYTTIDSKTDKTSTSNVNSKSKTNIESKSSSSKECCCLRNDISKKAASCCCVRIETTKKPTTNDMLKPRVSFIKPRRPVKTCKSDPVSLYQQYQKEWKKQKLPGEDKRYDLRWAIRERMLGEPELPVHPLDKLRKSNKF